MADQVDIIITVSTPPPPTAANGSIVSVHVFNNTQGTDFIYDSQGWTPSAPTGNVNDDFSVQFTVMNNGGTGALSLALIIVDNNTYIYTQDVFQAGGGQVQSNLVHLGVIPQTTTFRCVVTP